MGYYRPVEAFNTGKIGEHKERKCFNLMEGLQKVQNLECSCLAS